jgi:RNA polymerase sigma-70 factor (ECF subfamily)
MISPSRGQSASDGPVHVFQTTHWSVVLRVGDVESNESAHALEQLCRTYWFPIYAFVRKRGYSPEQAQDLTQEFFAVFLEKNHLAKAARERGRFRCFLMTSVENFLRNENDRARAQKRGGGRKLISIDEQDAEERYRCEPRTETDPAKAFEQRWAATLLNTVLTRLKDEFDTSGRSDLFNALQAHLWGDSESISYPQLAEQFGLTLANVKTTAHRLRQRYRELLREEIAHTVALPSQIDDEIQHLMKVVSE